VVPCAATGEDTPDGEDTADGTERLNGIGDGRPVRIGGLSVDLRSQEVLIQCRAGEDAGILEYLLVAEGGKAYESRFVSIAGTPSDLHAALLLLGIEPAPFPGFREALELLRKGGSESEVRTLLPARSFLSVSAKPLYDDGTVGSQRPLSEYIEERDGEHAGRVERDGKGQDGNIDNKWVFTGSFFNPSGVYAADATRSYAAVWPDPAATINLLSPAGNPYRTAGGYAGAGGNPTGEDPEERSGGRPTRPERFLMIIRPVSTEREVDIP